MDNKKSKVIRFLSFVMGFIIAFTSVPITSFADVTAEVQIKSTFILSGDFDDSVLNNMAYDSKSNEEKYPEGGSEEDELSFVDYLELNTSIDNINLQGKLMITFNDAQYIIIIDNLNWDNKVETGSELNSVPQKIWIYEYGGNNGEGSDSSGSDDDEGASKEYFYDLVSNIPSDYTEFMTKEEVEEIDNRIAAIEDKMYDTQEELDADVEKLNSYLISVFAKYPADYSEIEAVFNTVMYQNITDEQKKMIKDAYNLIDKKYSVYETKKLEDAYNEFLKVVSEVCNLKEGQRFCNYKGLLDVINDIEKYKKYYTQEDMSALETQYKGYNWSLLYTGDNQEIVNGYIMELSDTVIQLNQSKIDKVNAEILAMIVEFNSLIADNFDETKYNETKQYADTANLNASFEEIEEQKNFLDEFKSSFNELKLTDINLKADYGQVKIYVELYSSLNENNYTTASWNDLENAVLSIVYNLPLKEQKRVDDMAAALEKAYNALVLLGADYTDLLKLYETIPEDLSIYTDESVEALNQVIDDIQWDLGINEQKKVNQYLGLLQVAMDNLTYKNADYSAIKELLKRVPNESEYKYYQKEMLDKVLDVVDRIDEDLDIRNQEEVDKLAEELKTALDGLKMLPADYTIVDDALAEVPKDLSIYSDETVKVVRDAVDAVERDLGIKQQDEINKMAEAITNAVKNLKLKNADYSSVDEWMSKVPKDMSVYTEKSVSDLNETIKSIVRGLTILEQSKVDEMAKNLSEKIGNLEYKPADYSKLEAVIKKIPDDMSKYTQESVKAVNDVLDAIDYRKNILEQSTVDKWAEELLSAINKLTKKDAVAAKETDIAKAVIVIQNDKIVYNGKEQKPAIVVQLNKTTLKEGKDYVLTYKNNVNAGEAIVTITGKGEYKGKKMIAFTIEKAKKTITAKSIKKAINAKSFKISAKTAAGENLSYKLSNNKIIKLKGNKATIKNIGKVTVIITSKESKNYLAATKKITVTITPKTTKLSSVKNKKSKTISLKWKKTTGISGYQIQYGTNAKFKKAKSVTLSSKTTSKTLKNLKKKKTYYIRIRTYKKVSGKKYYSS